MAWHVVDRNCSAMQLGAVVRAAVPSHTVMIANLSLLDLKRHGLYNSVLCSKSGCLWNGMKFLSLAKYF